MVSLYYVLKEKITIKNRKHSKRENKDDYYMEKKDRRSIDPDIGSLNESDKSYVVRNYFSSMLPDPEAVSRGTPSMTKNRLTVNQGIPE